MSYRIAVRRIDGTTEELEISAPSSLEAVASVSMLEGEYVVDVARILETALVCAVFL